jgi:hypothetical protein
LRQTPCLRSSRRRSRELSSAKGTGPRVLPDEPSARAQCQSVRDQKCSPCCSLLSHPRTRALGLKLRPGAGSFWEPQAALGSDAGCGHAPTQAKRSLHHHSVTAFPGQPFSWVASLGTQGQGMKGIQHSVFPASWSSLARVVTVPPKPGGNRYHSLRVQRESMHDFSSEHSVLGISVDPLHKVSRKNRNMPLDKTPRHFHVPTVDSGSASDHAQNYPAQAAAGLKSTSGPKPSKG